MINTKSNMFQKIKDPKYRKLFISGQIKTGFPFQVRALRKARNMTQQDLARRAETTQTVISRIETNGAANLSVQTLLKVAHAFDVALTVRLDPIDRFTEEVGNLSPERMAPRSSEEILAELEQAEAEPKAKSVRVIATPGIGKTAIFLKRRNAVLRTYQPPIEQLTLGFAETAPVSAYGVDKLPDRIIQMSGEDKFAMKDNVFSIKTKRPLTQRRKPRKPMYHSRREQIA